MKHSKPKYCPRCGTETAMPFHTCVKRDKRSQLAKARDKWLVDLKWDFERTTIAVSAFNSGYLAGYAAAKKGKREN